MVISHYISRKKNRKRSSLKKLIPTLKKFTESPVEFIHKKSNFTFEPKQMSVAVTNYVAKKFNGNFKVATEWSLDILKKFAGAEEYSRWLVIER